ncbi:hypothetical protein H5410_026802 [Solanum commersonii]|uniref:Uncharacterized protein n=1 Tax=Solanum commersonii TaxID=4109 RepID=A0A9J5Z2K5_SOLCO|nr:hypothetical protein H5410_026802 [Solanum commersonii]
MLERKKTRVFQFLMKLRSNFESIKANILNRETLPDIDVIFGELIREEMCINTLASMDRPTQLTWLCIHQKVLINLTLRAHFKSPDHNALSARSILCDSRRVHTTICLESESTSKDDKSSVATALPGDIFSEEEEKEEEEKDKEEEEEKEEETEEEEEEEEEEKEEEEEEEEEKEEEMRRRKRKRKRKRKTKKKKKKKSRALSLRLRVRSCLGGGTVR